MNPPRSAGAVMFHIAVTPDVYDQSQTGPTIIANSSATTVWADKSAARSGRIACLIRNVSAKPKAPRYSFIWNSKAGANSDCGRNVRKALTLKTSHPTVCVIQNIYQFSIAMPCLITSVYHLEAGGDRAGGYQ